MTFVRKRIRSVTADIAAIEMNGSTNGVSPVQNRPPSPEYGYSAVTASGKKTESGTVMVSKPASSAARCHRDQVVRREHRERDRPLHRCA